MSINFDYFINNIHGKDYELEKRKKKKKRNKNRRTITVV